jgi:hypothetical protein
MVDRRSVLKLGAASVAGAFAGLPARALGAAPANRSRFLGVAVFTEGYQEGLAFAQELQARRVPTFGAGNDIAQLWYRDGLGHHAPIAGLTDRVTLFCLEELARSAGKRVLYRVDHLIDGHGNAEHSAVGPALVMEAASGLTSKMRFGREMASLASQFEISNAPYPAAVKRTGPFAPGNKIALVSWMIA